MSKKYDVYGIGNALVDIVTEVDNSFFEKNQVEKGVMTLVDEKRQHQLMKAIDMKKSRMSAGGSAANTMIGVNQFGGKSYYSCLVARDELGKFFLEDMKRNGVDTNLVYENCPEGHSGRCLVMTTPDADRTMNTFLGMSSFLSTDQINEEAIVNSTYVYLEGYLVASPKGTDALMEVKRIAEKNKVHTALTFSDPNMLRFFSKNFEQVVGASVDLLFCNEEEALMFSETDNITDAREKLKQAAKKFAITLGANGALIFDGDTFIEIEPYKVRALDTNGAGDMFAGAFLYGITHGHSYAEAGKIASLASSRVVSQFGPRLEPQQAQRVLKDLIEQ
ncbi:MAG TPA: adenosine kinase [Cytophagales bacterium]|nr:adenosine kinase [Cytophagales bacterium]HCR54956.1 adenosine kinase [Cytophagales bacterium]